MKLPQAAHPAVEIAAGLLWLASAVAIAGFTWQSISSTASGYPAEPPSGSGSNKSKQAKPQGDPSTRYKDAILAAMSGGSPAAVRMAVRNFQTWAANNPDSGYTAASAAQWAAQARAPERYPVH